MAFLLMADNSKCRLDVTSTALPTVVYLSRSPNAEARNTCARTLGVLAWYDDSRAALYGLSVARALVDIIEDTAHEVNVIFRKHMKNLAPFYTLIVRQTQIEEAHTRRTISGYSLQVRAFRHIAIL